MAALFLVLGFGLLGGAAAGAWINHALSPSPSQSAADETAGAYNLTRDLWDSTPVDALFPPTAHGREAGPGGADRTWTRIGVAPASTCDDAFDPLLAKVLAPVGCVRLLRATYTDATSSNVTTVGLLITKADLAGMRRLHNRWRSGHLGSRADLIPRAVPFPGTVAAGFGDEQRASWTVDISADLPLMVYAVSGFADGREVAVPQPAAAATVDGATAAPAQAGLGHDAQALADTVDSRVRKAADTIVNTTTDAPR